MATRQYIGARYVPKFYQNSVDGSTQWQPNVVYEPLTWVTLTNGHMYISKKQIPATVGTPSENIDYWLDIGNYNGFIAGLQDEIDVINNTTIPAVNNKITSLDPYEKFRNKKICVIGDSISDYAVLANNWVKLLTDFMANYNCEVINESDAGRSFASLKYDIEHDMVVLPVADYYILFIGLNDWQGSNNWGWSSGSNPLLPALDFAYENIYAKNHNAKWLFLSPMKFFTTNTIENNKTPLMTYRAYYENYFATHGYTVLSGYNMGEMNSDTYASYTLDGLHPNAAYAPIMFEYILDGLVSERSNITKPQYGVKNLHNTLTTNSDITFMFGDFFVDIQLQINRWSPTTNQWIDICDVPNILASTPYPVGYFSRATGQCQYRISNGKLQAFFFEYTPNADWGDYIKFKYGLVQMN